MPAAEKENNLVERLLSQGKAILVGEWRGSKPETIRYTAKTGAKAEFGRVVHTVELGTGDKVEAVKVGQAVPDGTPPSSVVVPFTKGQRVVIEVESMEVEKGNRTVRASGLHAAVQ